ncbi:unnamed protein product [Adineta steineri]|uniref:NAD(P)(+)--arginine ADP-ribosyltransferase n=2 Tax=Adineta steineri TaxID=433720 RepID=A0A819VGT4_9BILA|nr:unnamed protein product [Adineta steineri]
MIVSDAFSEQTIPIIHNMPQLDSIYIFCANKSCDEQRGKAWFKVKGVFNQIVPICESIKQTARRSEQDSMSMSFVPSGGISIQNLDQMDPSFMYTQLFKEIFMEIKFDKQHIKDLTTYCYEQYAKNDHELKVIQDFERDYRQDRAIWWYTCEYFLYAMLNRALRTLEVNIIIKMGFFVHDLHRNIEQLHLEQSSEYVQPFIVYRGQGMSKRDFSKMMKTRGGLFSFNNFVSTSVDRDVSCAFADSNRDNPNLVGVLFEMTIDPSISSTPFADLRNVSQFSSEKEILFSMHTVFRIGEIKQLDESNRLWQVQLTLTSDKDQQLNELTKLIRENKSFQGSKGWYRLSELLIHLGEFSKAEQIYRILFSMALDEEERAETTHQLGLVKNYQEDYAGALVFYEKALKILQKIRPRNHPDLANSYSSIGGIYDNMGKYTKAVSFYNKSLAILQKTPSPNHSNLATALSNIGLVYDNMKNYTKALFFHEKALEIRKKTLPVNHPDLAQSYNNMGLLYNNTGDYSKAFSFYKRAVETGQLSLPANHPHLQIYRKSLDIVKRKL